MKDFYIWRQVKTRILRWFPRQHGDSGSSIIIAIFGLAIVGVLSLVMANYHKTSKQVLVEARTQSDYMYLRHWIRANVECPYTLGLLGPVWTTAAGIGAAADCTDQEVAGARIFYDSSMKGPWPKVSVPKGPNYQTLPVNFGNRSVSQTYQLRIICVGNGAPVQLRPQARVSGSAVWEDLLPPPYMVCEYGPGVRDYMKGKTPW